MNSIPLPPYYAPAEELPAPLPIQEEIEAATEVLTPPYKSTAKVVSLGPHFIVKYGLKVDLEEGRTMMFVKHTTSVPVPTVYALFQDPEGSEARKSYIIMERVPGDSLEKTWTSLTLAQKQVVATQLKPYLTELRQLPSPGGYCSIDRKRLRADLFLTDPIGEDIRGLDGPFDTESELNNSFIQHYRAEPFWSTSWKMNFHARAVPDIFKDHPPTFTHGDFLKKNIMFDPRTQKVTIVDWQSAGWYPSYWEYCIAIIGCHYFKDDWSEWLDSILDVYRVEFAWFHMMLMELWS